MSVSKTTESTYNALYKLHIRRKKAIKADEHWPETAGQTSAQITALFKIIKELRAQK